MSSANRELDNVTIQDVARRAGVGVGTVSRVMNERPHVSETTRRRVLEAIEELGYHPDPAARGLRMGRQHTIGVLVPFFTHHFFVEILRGAERAISQTDYSLVVFDVERTEERDAYLRDASLPQRVDGLLVISLVPHPGDLERFRERGFPVVLVDAYHDGFSSIEIDHRQAAAAAVHHLLDLEHTKIGFVDRLEDPFTPTYSPGRYDGYRDALLREPRPGLGWRPARKRGSRQCSTWTPWAYRPIRCDPSRQLWTWMSWVRRRSDSNRNRRPWM